MIGLLAKIGYIPLLKLIHASADFDFATERTGLETIKELYATDLDLKDAFENCREGRTWQKFVLREGLLYRANKLCVPASFVRLLLLQEAHGV